MKCLCELESSPAGCLQFACLLAVHSIFPKDLHKRPLQT